MIDGRPRPAEPGPAQELWDMRDAEAQSAIAHNIGEEYQDILMSCDTSREMWLELCAKFQKNAYDNGKHLLSK